MRELETRLSQSSVNGQPVPGAKDLSRQLAPDTLKFLVLSLKKQWKCYRKQLQECQHKFSERSVHDLRVSARRLLSLLDLLAHFLASGRLEKAQTALKRHLDTFDELRDTQVQLLIVRDFRKKLPGAARYYRFLKKCEARLTKSTCKKARRLRTKPLAKSINAARQDVKAWLRTAGSRPSTLYLLSAVNRAFSATWKLKERIDPSNTHSIHCTRVAFKKFRYVIEALGDRMAWVNKRLLDNMHDYQTLMGDIQDSEVLLRSFQKFMRKDKAEIRPALRFEHVLQQRRQRLIQKYLSSAGQLSKFWPPAGAAFQGKRHAAPGDRRHKKSPIPHRGAATQAVLKKKTL